jgi:transcriptional regulator with XRE-family HTH domain
MSITRLRWGLRIKAAREALDIDQVTLAGTVGVSQQMVSAWESGRSAPTPDNQVRLAKALKVEWSWLFDPRPRKGEVAA